MEIPIFMLVVLWFGVACVGVLIGVAVMALPSLLAWFRKLRKLAPLDSHHALPKSAVRRMDREALVLEGEVLYLAD